MTRDAYVERVRWPGWLHLGVALFVVLAGWAAFRSIRAASAGTPRLAAAGAAVLVLGFLLWGWWRMRHLAIAFDAAGVGFGFGGLHRRVPRAQVRDARPETYAVSRYMGWGWRIGPAAGDRAYSILGHRRGVRLEYHDAKGRPRSVFLSCSDPEQACVALGVSVRNVS